MGPAIEDLGAYSQDFEEVMGPLWKGRFGKGPSEALAKLSSSLPFDSRLWEQDLAATRAHARALLRAGLLDEPELDKIGGALDEAASLFESDSFEFDPSDEDIHSAIERFLIIALGDTGAKIHAGRSRNDLVVTDLKLWLKATLPRIARRIHELQEALYRQAREHGTILLPGYTHLQRAQPVVLAHHLLAHAFALCRDFERIIGAYRRADVSSLGAAAFAGTTLGTDAKATALELGFGKVFDNSADAVSARDFALEFLAAGAILGVHLSRIGEELVLWTTSEFGFVTLDDAYSTGSSIMPHKKNPDVGELVRAKSARLTANLVHLLGAMKGLPLSYNRDMQEDKQPVFDSADTLEATLSALCGAMQTIVFNPQRMQGAVREGDSGATDLAEALVVAGVPFREAHEAIGKLVARMQTLGRRLKDATAEDLAQSHAKLDASMLELMEPETAVSRRDSHGGPAPDRVSEQFAKIEVLLDDEERWLAGFGAY